MAHAADQSQGHREIERGAFFANVSGSQIDGHSLAMRKLEAAVAKRGLDAFTAFLDGVVREADDVKVLHARGADVDFDLDNVGVDAVDGSALRFEEHSREKPDYAEG